MRGLGGSTLRGGQTVFHSVRMWGQLFQAAMLFAAFMTVAVPAWNLWRSTSGEEWYAAGMLTLAEFKLAVGYEPDSGQEVRFADGAKGVMKIRDIAASVPAWRARERIKAELFQSAWLDARAPRWSPFLEARNPRDFDMMAAALIPQQKDTVDPFWVTAARQLFSNGAGCSGTVAPRRTASLSTICSRPISRRWPRPWRGRWRSPSSIPTTRRPPSRCAPCSRPTYRPWSSFPTRVSPSR